jgi:hypothetical protein
MLQVGGTGRNQPTNLKYHDCTSLILWGMIERLQANDRSFGHMGTIAVVRQCDTPCEHARTLDGGKMVAEGVVSTGGEPSAPRNWITARWSC